MLIAMLLFGACCIAGAAITNRPGDGPGDVNSSTYGALLGLLLGPLGVILAIVYASWHRRQLTT